MSSNPQFTVPLGQRQLFLDSHGVERVENLARTMHEPEKKGAVLRAPEHFRTSAGPVIWDPERRIWKTMGRAARRHPVSGRILRER